MSQFTPPTLPFVSAAESIDYWDVQPSGEYSQDCQTGRDYARRLVQHMKLKNDPTVFGWVLRAQGEKGGNTGIEIGFRQAIAEMLVA